jgi:hypothetical protein
MKRIAFFTLFVLTVSAVVLLVPTSQPVRREKSGRGNRLLAARRAEDSGERALSKAREAYPKRMAMAGEGWSSNTQPQERTLPLAVRVVGYVFFLAVVLVAIMALAGGIAVGMEYLLGWPDTWVL